MKAGARSLLLVVIPLVVLVLALVGLASLGENESSTGADPRATTFSAAGPGTKAIFLVMQKFLPSVDRWLKPLRLLKPPAGDQPTTLLVTSPELPISNADASALEKWARQGGQLIIASGKPWQIPAEKGDTSGDFLDREGFSFVASPPYHEGALSAYGGAQGELLLEPVPLEHRDVSPVLSGNGEVVAAQKTVGKGKIIVIADGDAWSNERLAQSHNAAWLVLAALSWRNGRLLVDEYHQGFEEGRRTILPAVLSFLRTYWGIAFIQLLVAGALFLLAKGRRFGPLLASPAPAQADPLGRVKALAAMLEAAKAKAFSLHVINQFTSHRLGLPRRDEADDTPAQGISDQQFIHAARTAGERQKEHSSVGKRDA